MLQEKLCECICIKENEVIIDGYTCYKKTIKPITYLYGLSFLPGPAKSTADTLIYYKAADNLYFVNDEWKETPIHSSALISTQNVIKDILKENFNISYLRITPREFINWVFDENDISTEAKLVETLKITDFLFDTYNEPVSAKEAAEKLFPILDNYIDLYYEPTEFNDFEVTLNADGRVYIATVTQEPMSVIEDDDDIPA